jgi:serine/threonine protein phosphatase 1
MRVLAIGDIHGCRRSLDLLLSLVAPKPDDLLITLGDYVDRGPDSCGVIERLLALRKRHRLILLRGNHEQMMLAARVDDDHFQEWLLCGGRQSLASYPASSPPPRLQDVPERHWRLLEEDCVSYYETDTHFFVHANADADLPLDEQPDYLLYWESLLQEPRPHVSGKVMVCGHTAQRSGLPLDYGHAVCIDTWAYGRGWLTCLDVQTGRLWQANEAGQSRTGWLEEGFAVEQTT